MLSLRVWFFFTICMLGDCAAKSQRGQNSEVESIQPSPSPHTAKEGLWEWTHMEWPFQGTLESKRDDGMTGQKGRAIPGNPLSLR